MTDAERSGSSPSGNTLLLERLRVELLDKISLVVLAIGSLSVLLTVLRDRARGLGVEAAVAPTIAIATLAGLFLVRSRVAAPVRVGFLTVLMIATATKGLLTMGVVSPTGFWLLVAVVLTWVLAGKRGAQFAFLVASASITFCAWFVMRNGAIQTIDDLGTHSSRLMWSVLLVNIVSIFFVLFLCTRTLVGGVIESEIEASADKDRVQGILEGIEDAVFLRSVDEDRIQETNRGAQLLFAWTDRPLMGARIADLCSDDGTWTGPALERELRKGGKDLNHKFLWRMRSQDSREFWVEISVKRFRLGRDENLLVSIRDVDERVSEEREIEKLNRELESRVQSRTIELRKVRQDLNSFSYSVSHDLRAPLRAISGFASVLEEDFGAAMEKRDKILLEGIRDEVLQLGLRIEAILTSSRDTGGKTAES